MAARPTVEGARGRRSTWIGPRTLSVMRVLIVEGSARLRSRLAERFAEEGFRVHGAADGIDALATLLSEDISAVVLDVHGVKEEPGIELLVRLRLAAPNAMFVVLTNATDELVRSECLRRGADFFFDKSRDVERAVEAVVRFGSMTRPS
jgi:DNA-binding response OmpR family regulator